MDFLIHHMLRGSALRSPKKEALVHGPERLTYKEVWERTSGLAYGLRRAGIERGDRVGIFLGPSIPQALSVFGISQAGGVFVPINGVLFPAQVMHIANDCGMKGLVTSASKLSDLASILDDVPTLRFVVVVPDGPLPNISTTTFPFDELCELSMPGDWSDHAIEQDLAALIYTSGSTGRPKGVMLSHAQVMAGSSIVSTYLEITGADRILAVLPFSFDAGLNQLMTAFQHGGTLVMMAFVFAREIVETLLKERITGMGGVPTLWSLLAQPSSSLEKNQFPHLRYITNTGGAMPQTVLATLRRALPTTNIYLMYGLTEAFRSTYLRPAELDRRPASMGKAIPNTEILVINEDGGLCKPGEIGELVHRGPTVSMGYWGQPELTARVLRDNPLQPAQQGKTEKVCYSGDLVKMDEEGFLYFVGRSDAMIKSSGYRISPTEVEEVLFQSGTLREAAVIGIPDEVLGQAIKAFAAPKDGSSVDAETLIAFCGKKLPRHMIPRFVEILDTLPKTPSGKVDYPALRRREGLSR